MEHFGGRYTPSTTSEERFQTLNETNRYRIKSRTSTNRFKVVFIK